MQPKHNAGYDGLTASQHQWIQHETVGKIETDSKQHWSADVTAYAVNDNSVMALSMVGSATSLDALRAYATMGKVLSIRENGAAYPRIYSTKDLRYSLFKTRLPHIRKDHYILLSTLLSQPQLSEDHIFVMGHWGETEEEIIGRGLRQYVPVAVLPQWYKWVIAQNKSLAQHNQVRRLSGKGFRIFKIPLATCDWGEIVKNGLETQAIQFEGI